MVLLCVRGCAFLYKCSGREREGTEMKKKVIVGACMTALLLHGCGLHKNAAEVSDMVVPQTTGHVHSASVNYDWNGTEHWHTCECGEKVDSAPHDLDDVLRCRQCGLEVWVLDDGCVDTVCHDEYGNPVKMISYGSEGEILSSQEYVYEYDEFGNVMRCEYLYDGVLQSLEEYLMGADGSTWLYSTSYFSDGETDYMVYDENSNLISSIHYNNDWDVSEEVTYEYALDDNGEYYNSKRVSIDENGLKLETGYTLYEDISYRRHYDEQANLISEEVWEYEYNAEGKKEWVKEYKNSTLIYEILNFAVFTDEWDITSRYPENEIEYYEDGSRLVRHNGTNTEPELETMYNADGSVSHVRRYVYELFDNGNWKRIQVYQNDSLLFDTEYIMDAENIWSRKATMTEYLDDGTMIIFNYDENEEIISQTHYDANGNVI